MGGPRDCRGQSRDQGLCGRSLGRSNVDPWRCVVNVLVAYATKNGSTQEVASAIAASLREHGAQVALLPARAVREPVAGYDLVVLGAPLYSGRWHRDARGFLRRH